MLIFVSIPYSDPNSQVVKNRYDFACQFTASEISKGNVLFCPVIYGHTLLNIHPMPSDWKFWKNFCETFLVKCDKMYVLMIDGWETSEGVKAEIEFATKNKIAIEYIKPN